MSRFGLSKTNLTAFLPTKIGGCVQWLNADRGITLVDNKVSQWSDFSSNAKHATQSTAANRPTQQSSGMNGTKSIVFATGLSLTHTLHVPVPYSFAFVAKTTSVGGAYTTIATFAPSGVGGAFVYAQSASGGGWGLYAGANIDATASLNTFKRCTVSSSAINSNILRTNGSSFSNGNGAVAYVGGGFIGNDNANQHLSGEIAELIVFNRALSTAELQRLESYFAVKYGL